MKSMRLIVGLLALAASGWGMLLAYQRSASDWTKSLESAVVQPSDHAQAFTVLRDTWQNRPLGEGPEARALEVRYLNILGRYAKQRRNEADYEPLAKFWGACVKEHERRFPD